MAKQLRQRAPVQVNQFVKGLNTEAHPLGFPADASADEINMVINSDGSRSRRPGMDVLWDERPLGINNYGSDDFVTKTFRWVNASGYNQEEITVVQIGHILTMYSTGSTNTAYLHQKVFPTSVANTLFGFAVIDDTLVVATGEKTLYTFQFDGVIVVEKTTRILTRDLFGVDSTDNAGTVLTDPKNIQIRPDNLTSRHMYNLRNQTFALPWVKDTNVLDKGDPIQEFYAATNSLEVGFQQTYPSNADNISSFVFADATKTTDREVERFFSQTMVKTSPNTTAAPKGYFIIDALDRGASRLAQEAQLRAQNPELVHAVVALKGDSTPKGANVLAQYAGRIWYAGFTSRVVDGDDLSPKLSSYVFFGQTVQNPHNIARCYQEADPTSLTDSSVVETDGGFIKIDEAYNITNLVPLGASLFVVAENGIWRVVGEDENSFSATSYSVSRVSDVGCVSPESVVVSNNTLTFWAADAIYGVSQTEVGTWEVTNLTQPTIQTIYNNISLEDKQSSSGYYDSDGLTMRWMYGKQKQLETEAFELVLYMKFSAFTLNRVEVPVTTVRLVPMKNGDNTHNRFYADKTPYARGAPRGQTAGEYLVINTSVGFLSIQFAQYCRMDTHADWVAQGNPLAPDAFLLSGPITGGDGRLRKDVPYLTTYFHQTVDPSSCLLTAIWDWSPSGITGKWTSPRQVYRKQRSSNDGGLLATRNRIRGNGRSIAFLLQSEGDMKMDVFGWEYNLQATKEE